jgi:hypothetical protein
MDNSTAAGVTNNTIVPCRRKMMDVCIWWLRCRASQDQYRYNWDAGTNNWANYHTKHHPDAYHEAHRLTHAGIWDFNGSRPASLTTMEPWVSPQGFPPLFSIFYHLTSILLLHRVVVATRVYGSPDSDYGQTLTSQASTLANTTSRVVQ